MYNSHNIATRIKKRAKEQNVIIKTMLSECNLGSNTMSAMYHGKAIAFDSLAKIADYLDCSVDYLLGRVDTPEDTYKANHDNDHMMADSSTEANLLIDFRSLNRQGQEYILQTMDMAKDKYKKSNFISNMEEIG